MTKGSIINLNQSLSVLNFLNNIKERNRDRALANAYSLFIDHSYEVIAIIFRPESEFSESSAKGVNWLDTQRHLLIEYSKHHCLDWNFD